MLVMDIILPEATKTLYVISYVLTSVIPVFPLCWFLERKLHIYGTTRSEYDRAIGIRFPAGAKDFSCSFCVQTGSGAHPASCPMGTGGPFPGGKARPGSDADHLPPSSAEVENE
jgi:hypothetical protein